MSRAAVKRLDELVQIIDTAMAEAARKSGRWLACRPGCYHCCIGPFPITQLDALRLRHGLAELKARDPAKAALLLERAVASVERIRRDFPDDPLGGVLATENAPDEEPCPALDRDTGTCDLYAARPITCRIFGPAVRFGANSVATCELCYTGATDEEIGACEVEVDPNDLESQLLEELAQSTGVSGETIVAFALAEAS